MNTVPRPDVTEADRYLAEAAVFSELSTSSRSPELRLVGLAQVAAGEDDDVIARMVLVKLGGEALRRILEIDARAKAGRA